MNHSSIDFFYKNFVNEQMNFLYTGDFSDELTDRLIELNDFQFKNGDEFKFLQRKAAFLIAECFQNLVRHSDLTNKENYFHIKNNFGIFSLISGNTVQNEIIPRLKGQIEQLNKLTSEELKEVYRKTLSEGTFSDKGGAGLGLIEMARKTKNKLSFKFSGLNEIKSYFYFQLILNSIDALTNPVVNNFDSNVLLRRRMKEEDLFFVYNGRVSSQITSTLLKVAGKSFESSEQRVGFIKLLGFIEKVSLDFVSKEKENGMTLLVGKNETAYNIGANIYASNLQAKKIYRSFKTYKANTREALLNEHIKLLNNENQNPLDKYNLYLIKLFVNCVNFEMEIKPYNNTISTVSLILGLEQYPITEKVTSVQNKIKVHSFSNN